MKELDKLIAGATRSKRGAKNSSFNANFILDIVEEVISGQHQVVTLNEDTNETELSAAADPGKIVLSTGDTSGKKLLDISAISRKLIVGTESSARLQDVESSFETLRKTNPYIDGLTQSTSQHLPEKIIQTLSYYFSPPEELLINPCIGIGALFTRHILLDAYLSIFNEYNSQVAGFVNESFIAGLLGGQTISTAGPRKSIADFQLGGGEYGISLKTTDYSGKLSGSFANLMRTLGIKFRTEQGSEAHRSDIDTPVYPGGLYYLLFNKKRNSHKLSCFRVDRAEIIKALGSDQNISFEDGYYVFADKSAVTKLGKSLTGVLDFKFSDIIDAGKIGVSDLATAEQDISLSLPEIKSADQINVDKIIKTLEALSEFYSIYSSAVIEFAANPDYEILSKIKQDLERAAQFEPEKLISTEC